MRFVPQGPDVPDALLRAHEDGRVAFFCGAGISMGAGLPGFGGLVDEIHKTLGCTPTKEERALINKGQYDRALWVLERILGPAGEMRRALSKVLRVAPEKKSRIHKSLLTLSQARGDHPGMHLVTTNFDRLFENLHSEVNFAFKAHGASALPVPKPSTWDSIVYLHGLLDANPNQGNLNTLVLTSGDFGNAYLREGWAARFVTDLFRNFSVCFVGYSLDDPVMRYLMDAMEAEHLAGQETGQAYIFLCKRDAQYFAKRKNVTVIPYSQTRNHALLASTLREWARSYAAGENGKITIVETYAGQNPEFAEGDGLVEKMVWALSDESGICAARFATHDPLPSFKWTGYLIQSKGLPILSSQRSGNTTIPFLPVDGGAPELDIRQQYLLKWLARHWQNPNLIRMVLRNGSNLHPMFRPHLHKALTDVKGEKNPESENTSWMRRLWHLLLAEKVGHQQEQEKEARFFCERLRKGYFDFSSLVSLQKYLTPVIYVTMENDFMEVVEHAAERLSPYLDLPDTSSWGMGCRAVLRDALTGHPVETLSVCEKALNDGFETLRYLVGSLMDAWANISAMPSIEEHPQNQHAVHSWHFTVELLRDAWMEMAGHHPAEARAAYARWMTSPHDMFVRLALFAAKQSQVVPPREWLSCLLDDSRNLLWHHALKREVLRLLATTAEQLPQQDFTDLCQAIVQGPSKRDGDSSDWEIWLRLKKIENNRHRLPQFAQDVFRHITDRHPNWRLWDDQREEFGRWFSIRNIQDEDEETIRQDVPSTPRGIAQWLASDSQADRFWVKDNWQFRCQENSQMVLDGILLALREGIKNPGRFGEALSFWREGGTIDKGLLLVNRILEEDSELFAELADKIADWCQWGVRDNRITDDFLLTVAQRIYSLPMNDETDPMDSTRGGPCFQAVSHPAGKITEVLFLKCFDSAIHPGQDIRQPFKNLFAQLCSPVQSATWPVRVVLVSRLMGFYIANSYWTRENVIPLLRWNNGNPETVFYWDGLLCSDRIYPAMLAEFKADFLTTAQHLDELGASGDIYSAWLTHLGVWGAREFSTADYRQAIRCFHSSALLASARVLREWIGRAEESPDDRQITEKRWKHDVKPFIHDVWHGVWLDIKERMTPEIRGEFARLALETREEFPDALDELRRFLDGKCNSLHFVLLLMADQTTVLRDFPEQALELLSLIVREPQSYEAALLEKCLDSIVGVRSELQANTRYFRLRELVERAKL